MVNTLEVSYRHSQNMFGPALVVQFDLDLTCIGLTSFDATFV
jgi:hypothetical protein